MVDFCLLSCSGVGTEAFKLKTGATQRAGEGCASYAGMAHGQLADEAGTCASYGVQYIPHKVVIGADGTVLHNGTGDITARIAEAAAQSLAG